MLAGVCDLSGGMVDAGGGDWKLAGERDCAGELQARTAPVQWASGTEHHAF
jgi:hypothetical protein